MKVGYKIWPWYFLRRVIFYNIVYDVLHKFVIDPSKSLNYFCGKNTC